MDLKEVELKNQLGQVVTLTNYGATLMSWIVKDKEGTEIDILLGFNKAKDYTQNHPSFGSTIGRFANRIAGGHLVLDGNEIQLDTNNSPNHIHGGHDSMGRKLWQITEKSRDTVSFSYQSPDQESNYPGNLDVEVRYHLTENGSLEIEYRVISDKTTVCNLTNHAYFNLDGESSGSILESHQFQIKADHFLPINDVFIPTGVVQSVVHTALDLRKFTYLDEKKIQDDVNMKNTQGFDHNYVLGNSLRMHHAASVKSKKSGLKLDCYTDKPGLQFYIAKSFGTIQSKKNHLYGPYQGFCLEAQYFPDSPNHAHFPSTVLKAGDVYEQRTIFSVSLE